MALARKKIAREFEVPNRLKKVSRKGSLSLKFKESNSDKVTSGSKCEIGDSTLSQEEVESLVLEYRANARKLSRSIMRKWRARIELEELDSLVDLALCEAASRYNPNKGASFMTFLFYHLRGYLVRAVDSAANYNLVPAGNFELNDNSENSSGDAIHGGTASDIAKALCNSDEPLPDDLVFRKEMATLSNSACDCLDKLEQEVVYRLFALEQSLVDIAQELGYSRCHISRVKKRALEILYDKLSPAIGLDGQIRPDFVEDEDKSSRRAVVRRKLSNDDVTAKLLRKPGVTLLQAQVA